ncbi:MAG: 3-isopropylmalate dehydrogenase [Maribacter sp.]|uniref:3-isopropylmalate dehydrogenase n=1 Tax=Maribacter sp. TaxID=1897614 RepID=UPI003C71A04F
MKLNIAVLGGDGIGPEVIAQAVKCLQAVEENFGHEFSFSEGLIGAAAMDRTGNPIPEETLTLCKNSDAILFGAIGTPEYDNDPNAKVRPEDGLLYLRKELDLFTNIRPVKVFPALINNSPIKRDVITGTDLVIYRELTSGIYFGEKSLSADGTVAIDVCRYTEEEISRVAHMAFKAAKKRRRKLTLVDKAHVLETSRLWRRVVTEVAQSYPEVELTCMYIDNASILMALKPTSFDVILADNMFGDILSAQCNVLIGSSGLLPSASIGTENAMFEPIHGSYPQAKGKDIANPIAAILSAALLLDHFGLKEEFHSVVAAVHKSFRKKIVTIDILGSTKYGTSSVGDFIAKNIVDVDDILNINDENIGLGQSTII